MEFKLPEDHPFSLLIPLVEDGKIDPWSIDIASLAQLYIEQIRSMELLDMRIPANALSAATFLFKKKLEILFPKPKIHRQRITLKELVQMYDESQEQPSEAIQEQPSDVKPLKEKKKYTLTKERKYNFVKRRKIPLHKSILKDVIEHIKTTVEQKPKFYFSEIMEKDKATVQFTALMFIQYDKYADIYQKEHYGDIVIERV
ncbi:segregation/condensation protein A [Hydrogenobaculum acidophilum]